MILFVFDFDSCFMGIGSNILTYISGSADFFFGKLRVNDDRETTTIEEDLRVGRVSRI